MAGQTGKARAVAQAAERRAVAAAGSYAAALLAERQGYVDRSMTSRVAEVDAELARIGWTEGGSNG
jgi:hypothetical protein